MLIGKHHGEGRVPKANQQHREPEVIEQRPRRPPQRAREVYKQRFRREDKRPERQEPPTWECEIFSEQPLAADH